jgi:hypothetical protein
MSKTNKTDGEKTQDKYRTLAASHWKWVNECLIKFADLNYRPTFEEMLDNMEWAFINGFIHGAKHGEEVAGGIEQ